MPSIRILSVNGTEPPGGAKYQEAIAVLYSIGYALKMGLRFGKLPKASGYFDYKVGALETFWWSTGRTFEIDNSKTLRWQAFLMLPPFVTRGLIEAARRSAREKNPSLPYERASLEKLNEGRSIQLLHVGPYHKEQPAIDSLHAYAREHGLVVTGRHHEIYMSDPRRTKPANLKTVIRLAVSKNPKSNTRG
jgi:hypothetical protein